MLKNTNQSNSIQTTINNNSKTETMNNFQNTIAEVTNQIRNEFFAAVEQSTGSFHDKNDVKNLITRLTDDLKMTLSVKYDELEVPRETEVDDDKKLYTLEMITKAWENVNIEDNVRVDVDSAEFSMNYRNQVELDSAEVEIDYESITDSFDSALINAYNELTKTQNND